MAKEVEMKGSVLDPNTAGVERMLPISDIVIDDDFNARKKFNLSTYPEDIDPKSKAGRSSTEQAGTTITDLAKQMQSEGQLSPVLVRPHVDRKGNKVEGKYFLVAGFRRIAAAKHLGWTQVRALIKDMSDVEAHILNLSENMSRKSLTPYEVAMACKNLRDKYGMTLDQIGDRLTLSKSYAGFLTKILDKVKPELLDMWANGKWKGILTVDNLYSWSNLTHAEQNEKFQDSKGEKKDLFDEDGNPVELTDEQKKAKKEKKNGTITPPSKAAMENALERIKSVKGKSRDYVAGITEALNWVLAHTEALGDWYDPKAEAEAEKAQAAITKAEKALIEAKKKVDAARNKTA